MILSFGSSTETASGTALALSGLSVVALLFYALAALPGERFPGGLRLALLIAWMAHGAGSP